VRYLVRNTPLTQREATDLIACCESVSLNKNDYFLKAGMPVNKVGYLAEGILHRFLIDEKGKEVSLQFIFEEHFFTDLDGFYHQLPSGNYIQAIKPSLLLILPISELETLQEEMPRLKPIINEIKQQHLLERIHMEVAMRIGTAADQYKHLISHYPHLIQQVPLKYLASYLRITQQSLSRIRRKKI